MSYPQPPQGPPPQPPIPPQAGPHAMNPPQFAPATPWYFKKWFVVVMLIIFFPVGLVLCWLSPETKLVGRIVWSVLWGFLLLMRIAGGGNSSSPVPSSSSSAPPSSSASTPVTAAPAPAKVDNSNLPVGTTITAGDLAVTVNSVRVGDGFDGKAILADVTMKNLGKQPQNVSSLLMWEMRDSQGYKLDITIGVSDQHGTLDGAIGAGSQLRGELAFKLKDAKGALELIFSQPFKSSQYIWKIPPQ